MSAAGGRYLRQMSVAGALYMLVVAAGVFTLSRTTPPHWVTIALALAPLAPALLMLRAYLTYVRALDELQRRIQSEAMLIALAVVGLGSFAYGFLEEWAGFAHLPLIWVLPAIIACWAVAHRLVRRRYQ